MNIYTEGELVKCTGSFKNDEGELHDPETVKFVYQFPNGEPVELVYEEADPEPEDVLVIKKDDVGIYYVDLDTTDKPGIWHYRFYSTGDGQTAGQTKFRVEKAVPVAPPVLEG